MTTSHVRNPESTTPTNELKPEQALGLVGLGLMQKITSEGQSGINWLFGEGNDKADIKALKQRLELTSLALETGAPLTTAEVSLILGTRPNSTNFERAGLVAKRLSRNVWRLSTLEKQSAYWRN